MCSCPVHQLGEYLDIIHGPLIKYAHPCENISYPPPFSSSTASATMINSRKKQNYQKTIALRCSLFKWKAFCESEVVYLSGNCLMNKGRKINVLDKRFI